MKTEHRIKGLIRLGEYLKEFIDLETDRSNLPPSKSGIFLLLENAVSQAEILNPWFTRENILFALTEISLYLRKTNIESFLKPYEDYNGKFKKQETIGVVMAGNIPMAGFHDFLCVVLSGHRFLGKTSSEDSVLIHALASILIRIDPGFNEIISFSDEKLAGFNAIIATGSNNSFRYFEHYFGQYPHILRKNRNGLAILTSEETSENLSGLADDIFIYFGRGCRSVSKLYIPKNFEIETLSECFRKYNHYRYHHKFMNNYQYHKAIYLLEKIPFIDTENLLMTESHEIASPVSVLFYEYYDHIDLVLEKISGIREQVQCIVCADQNVEGTVKPGKAQHPDLWDYADGVDTMEFLLTL